MSATAGQARRATAAELEEELGSYHGSLERVRHWSGRYIYTPGVQHLAERGGAYCCWT